MKKQSTLFIAVVVLVAAIIRACTAQPPTPQLDRDVSARALGVFIGR